MRFKIIPSGTQFYFNIVASNGQVLATSERYTARASAQAAIRSIKVGAGTAAVEG